MDMGLDYKCNFAPHTVFLGLLLCPWIWGISPKSLLRHAATAAIDYILCSQRWRRSIQSAKTRPGADCGPDHKLLIAKFRLKLKKLRKTTRRFRYDLNQIPYSYTVEVTNRFKGLDLIDRVPEELWMEVRDILQGAVIKTIPKKNKRKKANGCLRRPYK